MIHKWKISRNIEYCVYCGLERKFDVFGDECTDAKYGHKFVPRLKDGEWKLYCSKCGEEKDWAFFGKEEDRYCKG